MNPLAKLQNLVGMFLEILQSNDPLADAPKTGPALLLSDCGLGDTPVDDEWKPSVHDDQGEALEPAPRTVNSLGPDERDARWVSGVGTQWKWDNGRWWHTEPYGVAGIWIAAPYGYTPNASSPYTEATAQPLTFRGWAVPAILEVLAEHQRRFDCNHPRWGDCRCGFKVLDSSDWDEHVGPILADRIACDPQRAMEALRNHQPDKVNR
jgi:hypothetical protein